MIANFANAGTEDIFLLASTKASRKVLPIKLHPIAKRKLNWINDATKLQDLKAPPSNHLEKLSGNLSGFHSIRINDQYRIIFEWDNGNAKNVEIMDYH
ncbi:MAG: type II toxin-antitoxin system RelE/ParE family toxin [Oligoflexales bacterium]|nr:type II toxin-antitoxin system RelE/ParE family toxin [Oligoflexales bacterium]